MTMQMNMEQTMGPKKMKPCELVDILNAPITDDSYDIDEGSVVLEEEMWGLENTRAYSPIGKLYLPVTYKLSEQGAGKKPVIGLITVFNSAFLENPGAFYNESTGFFDNVEHLLDHVKGAMQTNDVFIETKSDSATAYHLLMKQHIPEFLKLYDTLQTWRADSNSEQCIRKCFTDYR
jgi:hypothetical protein